MANEWSKVIRQVAARMNTIAGAQAITANASYTTEPFTAAQTDSAAYPYQMIVDACVQAEAAIAQAVGQAANHPWRIYLTFGQLNGSGTGLANGATLQLVGGTAVKGLLGYGAVTYLSSGTHILTERPLEDIERRNRNAGGFFVLPVYFYRIKDGRIFHTVPLPGVTVDYFAYDMATSYAQIPAGAPLFPTSALPAYVAGALSLLLKEDEYPSTAQHYTQLFAQLLTQIIGGYQAVDVVQPSSPITGSQIV